MGRSLYTLAMIGIIALTLWAFGYLLFSALVFSLNTSLPPAKADAAIILTGGGQRIGSGLDLLEQGIVPRIFISGVHPDATLTEVLVKQDKPLPRRLHSAITMGQEATDTISNATEASQWMQQEGIKTAILVTATYHMPRALYEFRMAAPDVHLIPYAVQPRDYAPDKKRFWWLGWTEYNKLLARWTHHTLMRDIKPVKESP